ncbi:MAG: hypothetical protein HQL89_07935 [Magnetococcales bacterium]|nr:hypothetical protein [Magnetococcales bacterium]
MEQTWDREKNFFDRDISLKQGQLQMQISHEIQKKGDDLSTKQQQLEIIIIIFSLVGLGTIVGSMIWIRNNLHATMAKRMETDMATLKDIAKKHNIERDWIENGRISLLSLDHSKAAEKERLLKDWGFKNIDSKVLADFEPLKNKQQIVLFNDDICKDQQEWVWKYIQECSDDTVFVAYTPLRLQGDDQAWNKLITANMPATLFGQLMTAFRYQDALIRARS